MRHLVLAYLLLAAVLTPLPLLAEDCAGELSYFDDARQTENKLLEQLGDRVWRDGDKLYFKLTTGRVVTVTDQNSDEIGDQAQLSSLMAYYPDFQVAILHMQFYEGTGAQLLNLNTGKRYDFHGVPCRSPDGIRLAAFNRDLEASFSPNGVWVFRVKNGVPLQEIAIQPQSWGVIGVRWESPGSAVLQCEYQSIAEQVYQLVNAVGKLQKLNGKWHAECGGVSATD
jgi:hypothetical protein